LQLVLLGRPGAVPAAPRVPRGPAAAVAAAPGTWEG